MTTRTWRRAAFVPLLALGVVQAGLAAQETAPADAAATQARLDPEAVAALESMAAALNVLGNRPGRQSGTHQL